jgi:hypothetical protein
MIAMNKTDKKWRVTCLKATCVVLGVAPFALTVVTVLQWMPNGPAAA